MNREQREKCRTLRLQGKSIEEIAADTGFSPGAIRRQVKLLDVKNVGAVQSSVKYRQKRLDYQSAGRVRATENQFLHIMGCMLYWGEGTKSRNTIQFINSDVNMLRVFLRFLRQELHVADELIAIDIQCHATESEEIRRIELYWLKVLQLPETSLRKTYIKKGNTSVKHRHHANGFCTISVSRTELVQHIYGAIQEYSGFDNPVWLG